MVSIGRLFNICISYYLTLSVYIEVKCTFLCHYYLGTVVTQSLVEELEKDRTRLQEELRAVRKSSELVAGSSSLSQVVEAQERRITALVLAQKVIHFFKNI